MHKAAYTACEPCKDHPERPPFWQVRATKIIENQETHTIYYEDAQLLFWGFPVFYSPYFSSPDSTVNKQTGLLAPQFVSGANVGYGLSLPYFINLAPNYDLTLTPTYLSKQGLLGQVDWRQRLSNGTYSIRATGIDEQQPGVFAPYPYGAGDQRLRGAIETKGNFLLNEQWMFGWDGTWAERQILSQRLPAARHQLRQLLFSGTSYRRSIYAASRTRAFSTSAPIVSRARRRVTTTALCRPPSRRCSTTIASSTFPPTAPMVSAGN